MEIDKQWITISSCKVYLHSSSYDNFGNLEILNFMKLYMYVTSFCELMFIFLDFHIIFAFAPIDFNPSLEGVHWHKL